jgi:hypothetical protein
MIAVNGHTLAISVGRSSGSAGELLDDVHDCVPMAAAYEGGMPRHPSSCVHFWQWSLLTPTG